MTRCSVCAWVGMAAWALPGAATDAKLTLVIDSDAACLLMVEGEPLGQIIPGAATTLELPAGEQQVSCMSMDDPDAIATATRIGSGQQSIRFTPAATWARFGFDHGGWIKDMETGKRWHPYGSTQTLDWAAAGAWCASLDARLPSRDELVGIHVHGHDQTPCGDDLYCGISHHFSLASRFVWTHEIFEGQQAIISGLAGQKPSAQSVPFDQDGVRALCIAD